MVAPFSHLLCLSIILSCPLVSVLSATEVPTRDHVNNSFVVEDPNAVGHYFRKFYTRSYALRTLNGTKESTPWKKIPFIPAGKTSSRGINWAEDTDKVLDEIYEKYERFVVEKKISKIVIAGNTQDAIDFAANQIYERSAGKLVDFFMEKFGDLVGAGAGRFVGGEVGVLFGLFFPEIELPLVLGGVFLGSNFGLALGHVSAKIGATFVNDLIEEKVIDPVVGDVSTLRQFLKKLDKTNGNPNESDVRQQQVCERRGGGRPVHVPYM